MPNRGPSTHEVEWLSELKGTESDDREYDSGKDLGLGSAGVHLVHKSPRLKGPLSDLFMKKEANGR